MMDSSLNCRGCLDLLDDYRRDALSAADRRLMELHLANCAECSEELKLRNGLQAALRNSLPESGERVAVLSPGVREALAVARHKHERPRKSPLLPWMLTAAVLIVGAIAFVQTSGTGLMEDGQTISLNSLPVTESMEEESMDLLFDATSGTSSSGDVYRTDGLQDQESALREEKEHLTLNAPAQMANMAAAVSRRAEYDSAEEKRVDAPAAAAPMAGAAISAGLPPAAPMGTMQQQAQVMSAPPAEPAREFYEPAKAKRELTSRAAPKKDSAAEDRSIDLKEFRAARASGAAAVMSKSAQYRLDDQVTSAALTSETLTITTDTLTSSPR